jgi:hypothetical protein
MYTHKAKKKRERERKTRYCNSRRSGLMTTFSFSTLVSVAAESEAVKQKPVYVKGYLLEQVQGHTKTHE